MNGYEVVFNTDLSLPINPNFNSFLASLTLDSPTHISSHGLPTVVKVNPVHNLVLSV